MCMRWGLILTTIALCSSIDGSESKQSTKGDGTNDVPALMEVPYETVSHRRALSEGSTSQELPAKAAELEKLRAHFRNNGYAATKAPTGVQSCASAAPYTKWTDETADPNHGNACFKPGGPGKGGGDWKCPTGCGKILNAPWCKNWRRGSTSASWSGPCDVSEYIPGSGSGSGSGCTAGRCGPSFSNCNCLGAKHPYCNEDNGWCGSSDAHEKAQSSTKFDYKATANTNNNQHAIGSNEVATTTQGGGTVLVVGVVGMVALIAVVALIATVHKRSNIVPTATDPTAEEMPRESFDTSNAP